jgi:hypothetical protein
MIRANHLAKDATRDLPLGGAPATRTAERKKGSPSANLSFLVLVTIDGDLWRYGSGAECWISD